MKKKILAVVLTATLVLSSGCEYINSKLPKNPPSQREQICAELGRNLVFNSTSVTNIGTGSATQIAQSQRLYTKYHCEDFEKK